VEVTATAWVATIAVIIVLLGIGSTDLLFALDSIPAVFGVTDEPYLVFTAILAVTTVASLVRSRRDPAARAHAGSLRAHPTREDAEPPTGAPS
jgi:Integral membrane protein TerC family